MIERHISKKTVISFPKDQGKVVGRLIGTPPLEPSLPQKEETENRSIAQIVEKIVAILGR